MKMFKLGCIRVEVRLANGKEANANPEKATCWA
jgi:hypothetical protein